MTPTQNPDYLTNKQIFLFVITLLIISIFLIRWSLMTGLDGDGPIRIEDGKATLSYFFSFGKDTTYQDVVAYKSNIHYKHVKYYGTAIESTAIAIAKIGNRDTYFYINKIRRLITTILSIISILYIGKFVKNYTRSWHWASFAMIIVFLSPTYIGYSFWQTKDAPVAAGFIISIYYIIQIYKNYPSISLKYFIGLTFGIVLSLSVRIHGVLIIFYFIVFGLAFIILFKKQLGNKKQIIKFILYSFFSLSVGYILGFSTYPVFWEEGMLFIFKALKTLSSHPQNPPVLFEGQLIRSNELPWYYLLKVLGITLPLFIFYMLLLASASVFTNKSKWEHLINSFLFFAFIFPVVYVIISDADLYGGWRHELFIYPPLVLFCTIGFYDILKCISAKPLKIGLVIVCSTLIINSGYWVIKNAPFQYFYYNEFVGGIKGAFTNYSLDDIQLSNEIGLKYLLENEDIEPEQIIAANTLVVHDMAIPNDTTSKLTVGYVQRNSVKWDYGIFNPIFVPPNILRKNYPPKNTIFKIEVDKVPICCIVERENFDDINGIQAYKKKEFKNAFNLFISAYKYDENNYITYPYLVVLSYQFGNYENARIFSIKQLELFPNDKTSKSILESIKNK